MGPPVPRSSRTGADWTGVKYRKERHHAMQIKVSMVAMLAVCVAGVASAVTEKPARGAMAQPRAEALIRVAHEPMDPGPAYRRYTGKVTALGGADAGGRIYSF